jgi:alkanesulfonate monooxygenase SsuD/methylene tetrahydromethanopterin reductase-like flavin-dependent oxidoreductase (luciferase family)
MLRLAAQYADLWNTAYLGLPQTMVEPKSRVEAACKEVGRDPATLQMTGLAALAYTDLLREPPGFENGYLSGTSQEITATMTEYERMGLSHLMFHLVPYNPTTLQ